MRKCQALLQSPWSPPQKSQFDNATLLFVELGERIVCIVQATTSVLGVCGNTIEVSGSTMRSMPCLDARWLRDSRPGSVASGERLSPENAPGSRCQRGAGRQVADEPHGPGLRPEKYVRDARAEDGAGQYRASACQPEEPTARAPLGPRLSSAPKARLQVGKVVEAQTVRA
jgi:hypothetical protein